MNKYPFDLDSKELNKSFLGIILFTILMIMGCISYIKDADKEIRIMTFNVRHRDEYTDNYVWDQRSVEILTTIADNDPDILAAQELNDQTWFGQKPAQDSVQSLLIKGLQSQYAMYVNTATSTLFQNDCLTEEGNLRNITPKAIFFKRDKFLCLNSGSILLLGEIIDGSTVSRYASWVILQEISDPDNLYFVINTHLAAGSENEDIRLVSVSQLISAVKEKSKYIDKQLPIILAGDLNSKPGSIPVTALSNQLELTDSYTGSTPTFSAWSELKVRLDYILVSSEFKNIHSEVVRYKNLAASDHLPLKTVLVLK
jgi:endonuclease/exonuclease/phosphatase family metal-dependent hydrolase